MKKIAIILSGCGNKDGSEITETISLLIAISRVNAEYSFFAPNIEMIPQNFIKDYPMNEKRNILVESARISRGQIQDINELESNKFDALAFPGGYGVAEYLCNWSTLGANCEILPIVRKIIFEFYFQKKPIAAICIAPILLARVLGPTGVTLTIGDDSNTIVEVLKTGARHESCLVTDCVVDYKNKIITTPAYMYAKANPYDIFQGILKLAIHLVEMA